MWQQGYAAPRYTHSQQIKERGHSKRLVDRYSFAANSTFTFPVTSNFFNVTLRADTAV